jgi:hypothetical protein
MWRGEMNDFDAFSTILSLERYFYYRKVGKYLSKDKIVENRSKSSIPQCHISQTTLNVRTTPFRIIEVVVGGFFGSQQGDFSGKLPCWCIQPLFTTISIILNGVILTFNIV